jgi:hypothetical protein
MFTIYLTIPLIRKQWAISHPKIDTVLAIVKHLRTGKGASIRVWSSEINGFII